MRMATSIGRSRARGASKYLSSKAPPWSAFESFTRRTAKHSQARRFVPESLSGARESGRLTPLQGISLSIDQFTALLDVLPDIEDVLKSKGITLPRPKYERVENPKDDKADKPDEAEEDEGKEENEEDEEEEDDEKPVSNRLSKFKHRPNHEATSDEDEG